MIINSKKYKQNSYIWSFLSMMRKALVGFENTIFGTDTSYAILRKQSYPTFTLNFGQISCDSCSICVEKCPEACIRLETNKAGVQPKEFIIDFKKCTSCSTCIDVCPSDSLVFSREIDYMLKKQPQDLVQLAVKS